jgi:CBS domain-containing protein
MKKNVRCCPSGSSLNDAAQIMWERDCGFVPVVDADGSTRVVGVVTDRDLCMAAYTRGQSLKEIRVDGVMSRDVQCCHADDSVARAEAVMQAAQVRRLPVVDQAGQLLGVISLSNIAQEAAREHGSKRIRVTDAEVGETLARITQPRELPEATAV